MLNFDDVLAARTALRDARLKLRELTMQAETALDVEMLMEGFSAHESKIANGQIWCLLGMNAREMRKVLDRALESMRGGEPGYSDWIQGRDVRKKLLEELEAGISPWDESFEDEAA